MSSGTVIFIPPNGANGFTGGQAMPGTVVQPAAAVQYIQYVPQPVGSPINQPQQNVLATALQGFLRVEPKTLGAIQIMIGLIHIGFGAISAASFGPFHSPIATIGAYPFWGGIFFIASGSVSVSAEKKYLTPHMVRCSVGLNITSAVLALIGIILYCTEFSVIPFVYQEYLLGIGISVVLFLFSLLEFCIAVSTAHFGCKAACCTNDTETIFVPYVVSGTNLAPAQDNPDAPPTYDSATASSKME